LAFTVLLTATTMTTTPGQASVPAWHLVHGPAQIEKSATGMTTSKTWAGFALTGVTFSDVIGSWVQPMVPQSGPCPPQQEDAAFWVGMDGYSPTSRTVEQIGTDSDCNKGTKRIPGGPHYYAWWQMYPQSSVTVASTCPTCQVSPGDSMTAEVSASGSTFTLSLTDNTASWTFSTVQSSAAAPAASAEWITEDPLKSPGGPAGKLADFGAVTFSGLTVTSNGKGTPVQISMKNKASTAMTTLSSFVVTWRHT